MTISRNEAIAILKQWTQNESLLTHARAVELVMRAAASQYGESADNEDEWGLAGLLHDADYDQWPDEHPKRIVAWLREQGEESLAHAISCHWTKWGIEAKSRLDRSLLACDELTGFIIACSHVRPEGVTTLNPKSVKKKLKNASFAASVERDEIRKGVEGLGVDLDDHITFVIQALAPHADELGIAGSAATDAKR